MTEAGEEEIRSLIQTAQDRFSVAQAKQIGFAAMYAQKVHQGQSRKDKTPYILHPLRVAKQLVELKDSRIDDITIVAALLHDVVEDTNKTIKHIQMHFGRDVANMVDALTKRKHEDRETEDTQFFAQITQAAKKDQRIMFIKLSDQIDNSRDMHVYSQKRKEQRLKHIKDVFIPLAEEYELPTFKDQLQEHYDQA